MTLVFPAMLDHNDYRKSHTIILSIPITPDAILLLPVRKKKSEGRPRSNSFVRKKLQFAQQMTLFSTA